MFGFNETIHLKIKEIAKKLFKLEKDIGNEVGLNRSETQVISCLADKNELTHTEIVTMCEVDKAAVSRVLSNMEKKGLIESTHEENNKKTLHAKLTEAGEKVVHNLKTAFDKCFDKHFGKLSKKDKEAIKNLAL